MEISETNIFPPNSLPNLSVSTDTNCSTWSSLTITSILVLGIYSGCVHSVDRVLDETRDNIRRTIEEARKEIPRRTQAFNDYQEHSLQTAREITDRYLESQKEIIKSFQSTWAPYVESSYEVFWNKWASPQKAAEIYARTVSNIADNTIVTTRIANNAMFANMEALKTIIEHRRDDVKEFSRMAVNTAKTFEQISRNTANPSTQQYW